MKKLSTYKIITITAVLVIVAAGVFLIQRFSGKVKKEITLNSSELKDDILSDSQPESQDIITIPESEKNPEKSEPKTQKESTPVPEPPKSSNNSSLKIIDRLLSSGFQTASGRKIDTIIIHSSYDAIGSDPYSVNGVISEYKDAGVSAHYLIDRAGTIFRLVKESDIAYHAGVSRLPDGRTNVNEISIGIELINTKDGKFTENQYTSLNNLLETLKAKYKIKYVLGHNQIAPGRKDDPWNFDWGKIN
jgi:hypothetical protein